MPRNTVTYHLRVLEREGLVSSARNGRNRLFFAPGALPARAPTEDAAAGSRQQVAAAYATLRHETTLAIAREIGANPGLDQKALCERVGLSPSLAHWHADRLVASGLVDKRREGRFVRYYPGATFGIVQARSA
ncbi:MAG TPA: winged helix-turn-helix transcriptional regulator [Candidatus Thermoplasmatota archaeon]|nr:winged helix-turn-helix transcriptional regulator [Candidatus Thermoplasmatota archaeon]